MYKDYLDIAKNKYTTIDKLILEYSKSGTLYLIKKETDTYFELIFNNQYNSPVKIKKYTAEEIQYSPLFYLDDDDILLTINELLILVLLERFESFFGDSQYKIKYHKAIHTDMMLFDKYIVPIIPFSYNNRIKLQNRIRIIKTYLEKNGEKHYFKSLGNALLDINIPNTAADIEKYAQLFNDPINIVNAAKGIYCSSFKGKYVGIGYNSDKDTITSIFPPKSNLPERLRQHYTSNYLEPSVKTCDLLANDIAAYEKNTAICVFSTMNLDNSKEHPLKHLQLIGGEILINKEFSEKHYYVRRTYNTINKKTYIMPVGTELSNGDPISYNMEGEPELIYDLNYDNAIIDEIISLPTSYKIVLKIKTKLSIARLISDYGLKGVTHPVNNLGNISISKNVFGEEISLPVEMVVGPNSMKAGVNGIRLSWLLLKQSLKDQKLEINPSTISEEEINNLTSDLQLVDWYYNDKVYKVYVGMMAFGVTDLSQDCRMDKVQIMPETLKYMYLSGDKKLEYIANYFKKHNINKTDIWIADELLNIRNCKLLNDKPVYNYNDADFIAKLNNTYFDISDWSRDTIDTNYVNNILLSPFNNGFYIKFEDNSVIQMPSAKLINIQSNIYNDLINYPNYFVHALWILMSIKLYASNKCNFDKIKDNINKYIHYINENLYNKKAAISMATAPFVDGGHLKQLISPFVPRGITVVVDSSLNNEIKKYKFNNKWNPIYEIGVRNPVVWRYQLSPKKVWTIEDFTYFLKTKHNIDIDDVLYHKNINGAVLRNSYDALTDQSDTDGDLYPIAISFDVTIQDMLHKYYNENKNNKLRDYELDWANKYIANESDNSKFIDIENIPFRYYKVTRDWFAKTFANAAIAKNNIGPGTIDLWKFHAATEYLYVTKEISLDLMQYMQFIFSAIVQDYIIRGIKHVEGGSSNYTIYNLRTFHKEKVSVDLASYFNMSSENIDLFIKIAELAQKNKQLQFISRLASGGNPSSMQKLLTSDNTSINIDQCKDLSYYKIIDKYYNKLSNFLGEHAS